MRYEKDVIVYSRPNGCGRGRWNSYLYRHTAAATRQIAELSDVDVTPDTATTESVGSHFTNYNVASYPDLTYAAENAVQAVVGIDVTQRSRCRKVGDDPFLEFFGIPQQRRREEQQPRYREQRGGGSGSLLAGYCHK